jgi:hypothetical protein
MSTTTLELRSLMTAEGELRLTLEEAPLAPPGPDEVVIRVDAAPINPSDIGVMFGPADIATLSGGTSAGRPLAAAKIPPQLAGIVAARAGKSQPVGNEGAGVVVDAGENARHLIGKVVGALGRGMYTDIGSCARPRSCPFPTASRRSKGASAFVNPADRASGCSRRCGSRGTARWCTRPPHRTWARCSTSSASPMGLRW